MTSFNRVFFVLALLMTSANCAEYQDKNTSQACDDATIHVDIQEHETDTTVEEDSSPTWVDSFDTSDTSSDSDIPEEVEQEEYSCEIVQFADPVLGEHMVEQYDTNGDGDLSQNEAEAVTELVIYHHWWQFPDQFNRDFNGIQCLVNLEVLEFEAIGAKDLSPLRELYSLRVLNGWGNYIEDITPLEDLTDLEEINLGYNAVTNLDPLQNLTNLTFLIVSGAFTDIEALGHLTNLKQLYFSTGWVIESLVPLDKLVNLKALGMHIGGVSQSPGYYYTPVEWWPFSPISKLTNLEELSIDINELSSIEFLEPLVNLKQFESPWSEIEDISVLVHLPNLTHLELVGNYVRDLKPLAGLTNLVRLSLGHNGIYDVTPLSGLRNLTWLGLSDNSLSDISPLEHLDLLWMIFLSGNPISCEDEVLDQLPVQDFDQLCP